MTLAAALTPLMMATVLAVTITTLHRHLPPIVAARTVLVTLIIVLSATLPALWLVSLGFLAGSSLLGGSFRWCAEALGTRQHVPPWLGVTATIVAVAGSAGLARTVRRHRRLRRDYPGSIEIAQHPEAFAVTLPGRGGHIVLSAGLVGMLDPLERDIVVAHERTHANCRHDRYLLVANMASAALPILRPLTSRLRFSLERWADEAAVERCGDRQLVARTLAKVAMSQASHQGALGFAGLGVAARVAALLSPPTPTPPRVLLIGLWTSIAATAGLALFQVHHLGALISTLCPG